MSKKFTRRELFELALNSPDATVQKAMDKLLFTVALAHGGSEIESFQAHHYHYGVQLGVPPSDEMTNVIVSWNNDRVAIRSEQHYMFIEGQAGEFSKGQPTTYYTLIEDRAYGGR